MRPLLLTCLLLSGCDQLTPPVHRRMFIQCKDGSSRLATTILPVQDYPSTDALTPEAPHA